MASGLLDIERRVELACLEILKTWSDLLALLEPATAASVVQWQDASSVNSFPSAYVECYNVAEFGLHTGNYVAGLRLGGLTYMDDDPTQQVVKRIMGALRSFAMQSGLKTRLNNTVSSQAAGSEVFFFAVENDLSGAGGNAAYIEPSSRNNRVYEGVIELAVVCMPSR